MRHVWGKLISLLLVLATLATALPLSAFAETVEAAEKAELYIKSVKLVKAETEQEARAILRAEEETYILLEGNLNQGTGNDGVWMAYTTTTDPEEAIYDIKLMNMKGGFTLTAAEEALKSQESVFTEMAEDLTWLLDEFVEAYEANNPAAQKAYKALNFFRLVADETTPAEENGLGYQIVHGGLSRTELTELIMYGHADIVDSVVSILTMGIQLRGSNWMERLSELGPYDPERDYGKDSEELLRRAEQLLLVLELYAGMYNAMDESGLIPDRLDDNLNPVYEDDKDDEKDKDDKDDGTAQNSKKTTTGEPETEAGTEAGTEPETGAAGDGDGSTPSAGQADRAKLDDSRYKFYKIVFDELDKYAYGEDGETLKDFICSLEEYGIEKDLYPLVSILTDGEFAALSYGCFLEMAVGAVATAKDFDMYDEVYDAQTKDTQSVYLYLGVDKALLDDDAIIGFTDAAQRHMAVTGDVEFYEKQTLGERAWEKGLRSARALGLVGLVVMGVPRVFMGSVMMVGVFSSAVASSIKSGALMCVMKFCAAISGPAVFIATLVAVVFVVGVSFLISVIDKYVNGLIDWDDNPIPEYMYDIKEVTLRQSSDDGIQTESMKRPVYALYEVVTDVDGEAVDLNGHSLSASRWVAMYVSYDRQGEEAKPIKAEDLLVRTGYGETPEGYVPAAHFGQVIAYDLNMWDDDDEVNGVYLFYKQDQTVSVDNGKTYYIYEVYLQDGESDAHCIALLKDAGYTPLNVNLAPNRTDGDIVGADSRSTYIGYKLTTNPNYAIRDIRVVYGDSQGELKYGSATYAACGSNEQITLYATKYASAGTPILAGGLICVNDREDAPAGFEPVSTMGGGPAVSFNVDTGVSSTNEICSHHLQTFLYFLPETTFTSGTLYISDLSFFYASMILSDFAMDYLPGPATVRNYWSDYTVLGGGEKYVEAVGVSTTYNPYRAVYGVKAALREDLSTCLVLDDVGYVSWNRLGWRYLAYLDILNPDASVWFGYNGSPSNMNGTVYLSGNPKADNRYDEESGKMSSVQPLTASDVLCLAYDAQGKPLAGNQRVPEGYRPVTDLFSSDDEAARLYYDGAYYWAHSVEVSLYVRESEEQKPYVSAITAVDSLTLYRSYGGYDEGLSFGSITDGMLLSQLAAQGATHFTSHRVSLSQRDIWDTDALWSSYDELNAIRFGYRRTDDKDAALRDLFLYYTGFSTDEPPRVLYRGSVKYNLLCEISYNLTGYNEAPGPGVYLYGTTDSAAGDRIIDFEVSDSPFIKGYETLRTMDGNSLVAEMRDDSLARLLSHPMEWGKELYESLYDFFNNGDDKREHGDYFLHIKREGDERSKQKPYIGQLYLTTLEKPEALSDLFEQGAEGYVNVDLNADAGGDYVYLGYSYTADPADAIKEIRAYHYKNPPATLKDEQGRTFTLVDDVDLNADAGGDYIYLYVTKDSANADPIIRLSAAFTVTTSSAKEIWVNGSTVNTDTRYTAMWGSDKASDLNKGAGGEYVYLMYTTVGDRFVGTQKTPSYGEDQTHSREGFENRVAGGKYVGGLYVMDKNTLRLEGIANGTLAADSTCDAITDEAVKTRLKSMGATTVIDTPIAVSGEDYLEGNQNKVFIGYSRTNKSTSAIRSIVIKTEILSLGEPAETIEVNKKNYCLVAEAATDVTELPRAINLIGTQEGQDLLLPRFYLYYSTTGGDPIYDLSIDGDPLKNGWITVRSAGGTDPFADVSAQAYRQYELADKDDKDFYDSEIVYTDPLFEWMQDVSELFDLGNEMVTPFYLHCKTYSGAALEETKPYIGEVFVAEGETRTEALAGLVAFEPDGYLDCNLNLNAGGKHVYLAYKRVAKARDALTDLVVAAGDDPTPGLRLSPKGESVKFSLVANVDLNAKAGGDYLYLYASDSVYTGNPIQSLRIANAAEAYLKCGVERVTVKLAEEQTLTDKAIDLNKGAGGDYLYLIMTRETTEGHRMSDVKEEITEEPTCGYDGYHTILTTCLDCKQVFKNVTVLPATGDHKETDGDGDHDCDVCGEWDITDHVCGEPKEEARVEATPEKDGSYKIVYRCTECGEVISESVVVIPAGTPKKQEMTLDTLASLVGRGSLFTLILFGGVAVVAIIYAVILRKKRQTD